LRRNTGASRASEEDHSLSGDSFYLESSSSPSNSSSGSCSHSIKSTLRPSPTTIAAASIFSCSADSDSPPSSCSASNCFKTRITSNNKEKSEEGVKEIKVAVNQEVRQQEEVLASESFCAEQRKFFFDSNCPTTRTVAIKKRKNMKRKKKTDYDHDDKLNDPMTTSASRKRTTTRTTKRRAFILDCKHLSFQRMNNKKRADNTDLVVCKVCSADKSDHETSYTLCSQQFEESLSSSCDDDNASSCLPRSSSIHPRDTTLSSSSDIIVKILPVSRMDQESPNNLGEQASLRHSLPVSSSMSVNEKSSSSSSSCLMHQSRLSHTRITFMLLIFLVNSIKRLLNSCNLLRQGVINDTNNTDNDKQQTHIMFKSFKSSPEDCHRVKRQPKAISMNNNQKSLTCLTILLMVSISCVSGLKTDTSWHTTSSNESSSHIGGHLKCVDGLVVPAWQPLSNLSGGDIFARGTLYFLALIYLFIGVSIVSDRFMAAIEVITSQEKEVTITKPNGETQVISVRVWNETVSNLTLMALGSSTPEILLSIIEVYAQDFNAGDLGPGTIVGSAAFNLFVIIAICVWVIPTPQVKKIKHLRVFFVTMVWSVFAYIWLYAILTWSSYGEVTIFEAVLTFAFFPMTVGTAYIADKRLLVYKYLSKQYRTNKRGVIVTGEGGEEDMEMGSMRANNVEHRRSTVGAIRASLIPDPQDEMNEFEKHRMEYINIIKELRRKNPDASVDEIEQMAREEIFNRGPKSRAFYRIQVRHFRFTFLFPIIFVAVCMELFTLFRLTISTALQVPQTTLQSCETVMLHGFCCHWTVHSSLVL
jgi:Ca2+/Na+ antiporter